MREKRTSGGKLEIGTFGVGDFLKPVRGTTISLCPDSVHRCNGASSVPMDMVIVWLKG